MKYLAYLSLALVVVRATANKRSSPYGIDVSSNQGSINWDAVVENGIEFAYIKATDGLSYRSPSFNDQDDGAAIAGLIYGAYHFARPDASPGYQQANYFLENGGGWSPGGVILPGAVYLTYNPDGDECYNLNAAEMDNWINSFSNAYAAGAAGRYPVIHTKTGWWKTCTGNSASFGYNSPLWIEDHAFQLGDLPNGWSYATFWQYANNASPNPGNADVFLGDSDGLRRFAHGG